MSDFLTRQAELQHRINIMKPNSRARRKLEDLQLNNTTKQLMRKLGRSRRRNRRPATS